MKTNGSRAAVLIAVAVLTPIALPSAASPQAAKAAGDCPRKSLCVWSKANYKGELLVIDKLGASNKILKKMNDRASSAQLRYRNGYAALYEDPDGEGDTLCLLDAPGVRKYPDLSQVGGGEDGYDNMISSSVLSEKPFNTCF